MPDRIKTIATPKGITRLLFRFPLVFYRLGLGRLLGSRFLMLEHRGRVSGLTRSTVLEVVRADPASSSYFVASAWGEASDWYRNLKADPFCRIYAGGRALNVQARFLDPSRAYDELLAYARENSGAASALARFMGYQVDGTPEDFAKLSKDLKMVVLMPGKNGAEGNPGGVPPAR
jgi:deazaflavin-dependent oxidoreductase (nitroreductase family)